MKLFHDLTKKLKPYENDRFLLALSGGLDSMALFHIFCHFKEHFKFEFAVVYCHHGPSDDPIQLDYRFNAWSFLHKTCTDANLSFFSNYSGASPDQFLEAFASPLQSEEDFRLYRYRYFGKVMQQENFQHLVLGHHRDDLLETRLLRLLRGTGPEGLKAMSFRNGSRMRPLLDLSRQDLASLVFEKGGKWLEDPSNKGHGPLRNWLRKKWLRDLEERFPGANQNLARSLDLLVCSVAQPVDFNSYVDASGIRIDQVLLLGMSERRQVIANYMKSQDLRNYGLSHINEVLKRLDMEQKSHTFRLLGRCWIVDAGRMSVQGPS